jgi:hypothetical protein
MGKMIQLNHEVAVAAADVDDVDAEPDLAPEPIITEKAAAKKVTMRRNIRATTGHDYTGR